MYAMAMSVTVQAAWHRPDNQQSENAKAELGALSRDPKPQCVRSILSSHGSLLLQSTIRPWQLYA